MARPAPLDQIRNPLKKGPKSGTRSTMIPVRRDVKDTTRNQAPRRNNLSSGMDGTEPKLPRTKQ